jgi:hypothetical protein
MVGVGVPEVDTGIGGGRDHLGGATGHAGEDGVEERVVHDLHPDRTQRLASVDRVACTRSAMARRPSGPCHTAYMPAITASRTCAVQMLEVARSRRMCCSRVCSARR